MSSRSSLEPGRGGEVEGVLETESVAEVDELEAEGDMPGMLELGLVLGGAGDAVAGATAAAAAAEVEAEVDVPLSSIAANEPRMPEYAD